MDIRSCNPPDIPEIARLYFNTIHRINSRDYTPEQIQAWAPSIFNNSYWSQRFIKRKVLVAEDRERVLGFAEYEPSGHIDCFYVHHEFQGRGVGTALMLRIEEEFQKFNVRRSFAEVSITARGFFDGKGFKVIEERNTEYNDVELRLYLMEKYLGGQFT